MTQDFFINKNSTLPYLRMELFNDGRNDFHKQLIMNNSLQNCHVTFSMKDVNTGILKISKSPCEIVMMDNCECNEKYIIQYKWKERDTKQCGVYKGWFEIDFSGNIQHENIEYPEGKLIVPIQEDLIITVK